MSLTLALPHRWDDMARSNQFISCASVPVGLNTACIHRSWDLKVKLTPLFRLHGLGRADAMRPGPFCFIKFGAGCGQ